MKKRQIKKVIRRVLCGADTNHSTQTWTKAKEGLRRRPLAERIRIVKCEHVEE